MKASVIMPVYNVEKYIGKMLESVTNQTYREIEIIVINDGSTDHTGSMIEAAAASDSRIHLINKKNEGVSKVRNDGLKMAKGEWIFFFDGDDFVAPDCIEKCIQYGESKKLDAVMYGYTSVKPDGTKSRHEFTYTKDIFESNNEILQEIIPHIIGISCEEILEWVKGKRIRAKYGKDLTGPWSMAYKKSIIEEHKIIFKEVLPVGEDTIFVNQYLSVCERVALLNEPFYFLYNHSDSTIGKYKKDIDKMFLTKLLLIREKKKFEKKLITEKQFDISSLWGGEVVLSVIQLALGLAESKKKFSEQTKMLKTFMNNNNVKECIHKMKIKPVCSTKIVPIAFVRFKMVSLLLIVCRVLKLLHVSIPI